MATDLPSLEEFRADARDFLAAHLKRRDNQMLTWGAGSDRVDVFDNLTFEEEAEHLRALGEWQRAKMDAGFGAITWPTGYGGRGLPRTYEIAYREEESAYLTPGPHEAMAITLELIAPTILAYAPEELSRRLLPRTLRCELMWCQLFSEPGAGSDLASLSTRADVDGDDWVLTGQKVWTSGARHAHWGMILCRTDRSVPKHAGITAFILRMDSPGVEVRPLRQMSGGSAFNEVFLDGVRVPDRQRIGPIGGGWRVALTTLGFERTAGTDGGVDIRNRYERLVALARHEGRISDPVVRQLLAKLHTQATLCETNAKQVIATLAAGETPGPEGSIGKILYVDGLATATELATLLLGPRLVADSGQWGTYAWSDHVCGAPGFRFAGGTDEILRNILAERVLGLPRQPVPAGGA